MDGTDTGTGPGTGSGSGSGTDTSAGIGGGAGSGPGAGTGGSGARAGFRLLDVTLHTEESGRIAVELGSGTEDSEPLVLAEGTVVSVGLTFLLGAAVDGLVFEEEWARDGLAPEATTRTPLGGFRNGGPYEVWLPPRRMPVGRAHCGLYGVAWRLTDGHGRELARERHHVRLIHLTGTPEPRPVVGP
ncbi:hypothetical protein ABT117_16290 [Streptomyces sp. NPDC002262]|uniref:hypothetical protein n=1 Tax=Streptomyces sp. NPDC002262 TaxID=3154414 RepID=UPI003321BCEE